MSLQKISTVVEIKWDLSGMTLTLCLIGGYIRTHGSSDWQSCWWHWMVHWIEDIEMQILLTDVTSENINGCRDTMRSIWDDFVFMPGRWVYWNAWIQWLTRLLVTLNGALDRWHWDTDFVNRCHFRKYQRLSRYNEIYLGWLCLYAWSVGILERMDLVIDKAVGDTEGCIG